MGNLLNRGLIVDWIFAEETSKNVLCQEKSASREPAYTEQFWTLEMVQSDRDFFARFSVRD